MLKNAPSIYSESMLEHLLKNARAFLKEHLLFNITGHTSQKCPILLGDILLIYSNTYPTSG